MLSNEATAYVLAAILFFIVGLIVFCCCRIWYDLLGCKEHRRNRSGAHGRGRARADGEDVRGGGGFDNDDDVMTDPEESGAAKPLTNSGEIIFTGGKGGGLPVMRIIVTDADRVEQQLSNNDALPLDGYGGGESSSSGRVTPPAGVPNPKRPPCPSPTAPHPPPAPLCPKPNNSYFEDSGHHGSSCIEEEDEDEERGVHCGGDVVNEVAVVTLQCTS